MSLLTPKEAERLGRAAFHDGKVCAPSLDEKLIPYLSPLFGEAVPLLKAWLNGWTKENLKAEV